MPLLALTASTEGVTLSVLFNQVSPNSFAYTFKRHRSGTGRVHRLRAGGLGRGADSSGDIIAEFSEVDMNKISNAEAVSRRKALALVGLGAVLGL